MKINSNILLWIAVVFLAVLYLRSCDKKTSNIEHDGINIERKIDTLYIKGKSDTVFHVDTLIKYKYLESTIIDVVHDTVFGDTIRTYKTSVDDTLLIADITTKVKGALLNTSLSYKPKFPKYITRVDTIQIKDSSTVTITKEKIKLYLGANFNSNDVVPSIVLKNKEDVQFSLGYSVINKTYNFGLYTKVPNPFKK